MVEYGFRVVGRGDDLAPKLANTPVLFQKWPNMVERVNAKDKIQKLIVTNYWLTKIPMLEVAPSSLVENCQ